MTNEVCLRNTCPGQGPTTTAWTRRSAWSCNSFSCSPSSTEHSPRQRTLQTPKTKRGAGREERERHKRQKEGERGERNSSEKEIEKRDRQTDKGAGHFAAKEEKLRKFSLLCSPIKFHFYSYTFLNFSIHIKSSALYIISSPQLGDSKQCLGFLWLFVINTNAVDQYAPDFLSGSG